MIELIIDNMASFKCFFDVISSSSVITLEFEENNLLIKVLNKSHTCFYQAEYDKSFFKSYLVDGAEQVNVDAYEFYKILDSTKKDEVLTLTFHTDTIKFDFKNEDNHRLIRTGLLHESVETPPLPSVPTSNNVFVDLNTLKSVFDDANKLIKTSKLVLGIDEEFYIKSSDEDWISYHNTIQGIVEDKYSKCFGEYSVEFLNELPKFKKIDNNVKLKLGRDSPLVWVVENEDCSVKCSGLIAPRLSET